MKFIQVIIHNMSLRKTIRTILESVLAEEGKTITCQNCFHSWEKTPSDKTPYFCHVCGFDNKTKEFDQDKLKDWMKKQYQLNESMDSDKVFSGEEVNRHIESITPNESDIPDWFMDKIIAPRTFKVEEISLDDLLNTDSSFKEYFESGEERYDQDEMYREELYQELVVVDGILLDGYNRASTLLRMGENNAYAFVALPKK
jgi:hypothetical protein